MVVLWMMGALLSLSLMAVGARELSGSVDTFQTLFIRSVIGLAIISVIIYRVGGKKHFITQRPKLHIVRNLFHFGGQYGWFLGEQLTARRMLAVALGVTGVVVILKPGIEMLELASLVVLASALSFSCAYVATKSLSRSEHPLTVLFYMCLVQMPVSLILALPNWSLPRDPEQWWWLFIVGVTALTAHFCITTAMKTSDAGIVVTLDFLRLPLIGLVGILFYREAFDMVLLLGAGLMLAGNLINIYRPRKQRALLVDTVAADKE